jgi:hypothetical protein
MLIQQYATKSMIEINFVRKLSKIELSEPIEILLKMDKYYEVYLLMRIREYFELFQFSYSFFHYAPIYFTYEYLINIQELNDKGQKIASTASDP